MLRIGDFSRLSQVTVKALRHYDEIGLFKPVHVDEWTDYRYYAVDQLPRLHRILALKDLGFSLDEIARLLNEGLPAAELRGMLRMKQSEQQGRVAEEQLRLARVEARVRHIEMENNMPEYEMVIKKVEPQLVASVRDTLQGYPEVGRLFGELYGYVCRFGPPGMCGALWHDPEYREKDIDGEAVLFLQKAIPESGRIKVYTLPGVETMACAVHHGPYNSLTQAYSALCPWIEANGYQITGTNREVYLRSNETGAQDDPNCITEIQFPVAAK